jgi:hypothetical protein
MPINLKSSPQDMVTNTLKEPEPSDNEGLMDVQIIRALYQSIETGSFIEIESSDNHLKLASQV